MSNLFTLQSGVPIVDQSGSPTQFFLTYMQQLSSGLSNSSGASMPAPPAVVINYDYSGTTTTDLPKLVKVQRFLSGDDVSAKCRWFLSTVSGTITATIDQTGVITITALGVDSVLQAKSVRDGLTLTCNVTVTKNTGAVPSSGSGGSATSSVSSFTGIFAATDAAITSELTVTVGATGTVTLNAPLTVSTAQSGPVARYRVWGHWEWWDGATWQVVTAEVQSSPDCSVEADSPGYYVVNTGSLTVNTSRTGLTVGSSQKFRLMARNNSGTRFMTFSGTASAIP